MKLLDKSEIFEKEIDPLMMALIEKCKEHNLPMFVDIVHAINTDGVTSARYYRGSRKHLLTAAEDLVDMLSEGVGKTIGSGDLQ